MRSSNLMASPFFSSSFCALITGGRNAPSEGAPNTTMETGSGAWANEGGVAAEAWQTGKR